ncbi:hypothetical protein ACFOLJ_03170 [Rugamonas sp. CCM 8940]|uniref:hypothetical protein n=1 Tax=Rugamonas sp. CCM 8940 TaxID=2765359 RepID=UPI0018F28525|nr:hypothetical protein [Rugamonas sp. CCM 8940]MBJ7311941.1 hypothetical protein [Rugamonas sp. CCM 8940]
MMALSISEQTRAGAARDIAELKAVDHAGDNVDDVTTFTKFIKKAEEVAQAAL